MRKLALVGNSNVGKSSLTEWLLGRRGAKRQHFTGKRGKMPGTTLKIKPLVLQPARLGVTLELVDLPGFGFMKGTSRARGELVKDQVVRYLEENAGDIALALLVVNAESFPRAVAKWEGVQIPLDMEFLQFLNQLRVPTAVVANKTDKLPKLQREAVLDLLGEKIGEYLASVPENERPRVFPTSMKTGEGTNALLDYLRGVFSGRK
ncbi:MAG: GTPase [Promethearchaeota archaeon]